MIRGEIHRILVSQPMSAQPYDAWKPPRVLVLGGERIQITAHMDEFSHVVERWQFSETDVRWYRLEKWDERRVSIKVQQRAAVA